MGQFPNTLQAEAERDAERRAVSDAQNETKTRSARSLRQMLDSLLGKVAEFNFIAWLQAEPRPL